MIYLSNSIFKAITFMVWICLVTPSYTSIIRGDLPSLPVIAHFLKQYIKPYMDFNSATRTLKLTGESYVRNVIRTKIEELRPCLQDNDTSQDSVEKFKLEGEDETTIIEFVPDDHQQRKSALRTRKEEAFKKDIIKYKNLKTKIDKELKKETLSKKTKKLVSRTFDDMLAQMIGNQCNWKSTDEVNGSALKAKVLRQGKPMSLANIWEQMWKKLKPTKEGDGISIFLKHFQEFVTKVLKDTQSMSDQYTVVCELVNPEESFHKISRSQKKDGKSKQPTVNKLAIYADDNETCTNFKICSEELYNFLVDFYINLNDTAVSTLRNYGAMFMRDVKEDIKKEKESVIALINQISDAVEHKISIIFKKKTERLELSKNKDKNANIKYLKNYVKKSINHVKKQIIKDLDKKLNALRPKLKVNIQKDIDVNLDVDLGNLEREVNSKICLVFEVCNGKYVARRQTGAPDNEPRVIDKNSVYVKVQLTLDDNKVIKPERRIALEVGQAMKSDESNTAYNRYQKITRAQSLINVTRTTDSTVIFSADFEKAPVTNTSTSPLIGKQIQIQDNNDVNLVENSTNFSLLD